MSADGFVLAGGLSTRMGRDKARVPWGGRPMALAVADVLAAVCGRVAIVRRAVEPWPLEVIVDPAHEGTHPLFGVAAALEAARTELVVVVPCDVPRLTASSVAALLAVGGPAVADDGARRHPLVGVYPKAWAARALEGARAGIAVGRFARDCVGVGVPVDELANVNAPDDLAAAAGPWRAAPVDSPPEGEGG